MWLISRQAAACRSLLVLACGWTAVSPQVRPLHLYMKFGVPKGTVAKVASSDGQGVPRHSSGFDQFCGMLKMSDGLSVLDLSDASQANISFVTGLGHRISSDDIVGNMFQALGDDFSEGQQSEAKAARFLEQALTFPSGSFDGALVWDAFQFLGPPLINQTVEKLLRVVRPGGMILAFFNANEKIKEIPVSSYRIHDSKTLRQIPRGAPQRVRNFNNRAIERLFDAAASVKFFLTRDNLREVLIRR